MVRTLVEHIEADGWSVRRAEKFVTDFKATQKTEDASKAKKVPKTATMALLSPADEKTFRQKFRAKFAVADQRITLRPTGTKLKLTIEFANADELSTFQKNL
jgi:hypothetical protein